MKLLHTSDWHLGRVLHERSLLGDQAAFLNDLIRLLETSAHDALVIAGDVFDRSIAPEEAVDLFGSFLHRLRAACPHLPIVAIAGNHDSAARLAYASPLLALTGVHLVGEPDKLEFPIRITTTQGEEADVFPVPFLWPGSLTLDREGEAMTTQTQAAALEEAIRRIRTHMSPDRAQILVAHCFAQGGSVSDSERVLVGTATQVATSLFEGFDYVALGHLHRAQRVRDNAWYSGSPIKYSFSEASDEKALLSVEIRRGAAPEVHPIAITPTRELSIVKGTLRELCEDPAFESVADHYLRAELIEAPPAQPFALLRKRFPHLLDLRTPPPTELAGRRSLDRRAGGRIDLESDFLEFHAWLHKSEPPSDEVLAAFRELCAREEREREVRRAQGDLATKEVTT
jgi:exonuclease SbcD